MTPNSWRSLPIAARTAGGTFEPLLMILTIGKYPFSRRGLAAGFHSNTNRREAAAAKRPNAFSIPS
jgi:hypothetical protein